MARKTLFKALFTSLIIISLAGVLLPGTALAATVNLDSGSQGTDLEQILVKFKADANASEIAQIHRLFNGRVKEIIPSIGVQVVIVPTSQKAEKIKNYRARPEVLYAENDSLASAAEIPDDTYWNKQWNLNKVQASEAWGTTHGSHNINIAIVDTGIDTSHPDLVSKISKNVNFTTSTTTGDIYGHGTHVAGIAAAETNNATGVAGLGFDASIFNVKVLGDNGFGYNSWVARGIIWAADNGAQVINLSLGDTAASMTMEDAVNYAWSKGVLVVAAAGNSGTSSPFYPAITPNCIAVAATDPNDNLASWSNRGDWIDVSAPGVSIYSTVHNNGYGSMSGTSMATPHAAGLAALLYSMVTDSNGNGRINDEVRDRLENTADPISISGSGKGRINAFKAVNGLQLQKGSISGTVTDYKTGLPVDGVMVSTTDKSVVTDSTGYYQISDMPTGSYVVTAVRDGYGTSSMDLTVIAGEATTADLVLNSPVVSGDMWVEGINFTVKGKTLTVSPVVKTANGVVSGANIEFETILATQDWYCQGVTNSSGIASMIIEKPLAGTYVVTVNTLSAGNYTWNMSKGIISAAYVLNTSGKSRK